MSAPPPPYQNQQPQQPYGYAPPPQMPYGQQPQYGQQQSYAQPPYAQQPYVPQAPSDPRPPQGPGRRSPLHSVLSVAVVLAVFGGGAWYVWKYNTDPNGGKAKAEATRSAQAEENKKYDPKVGDCVRIQDPQGDPLPVIVDCKSAEAQYRMADTLYGPDRSCGSAYDYGIRYSSRRSTDYTLCFKKV
ncbi:hypothetical protein [Kitasatospora sp. NPDC050463]|uniref:LppU/SCO3897 family protein n=1 Tax=Kitasatospora sp. NPDC050463 TaxID=3155786 RepID=UPI0033CBE237